MRRCHVELGCQHVRFHALLSDELFTLTCQNEQLLYSFFNTDQIFDFLLSIGMKPFVELSFMPETLACGGTTVFSYRGNVTPPKDYNQWATLIQKITGHWVDRYGAEEVRQWFFEVWNEPNLKAFWTGTQDEYFQFYRRTAEAVKAVDPALKVGGPATADNSWIQEFLDFCTTNSVPVDFVSTHHYPTDAFGLPGTDTITQLEHAPRDIMHSQVAKSRDEARGLPLYYTEWNISSNPRDPMHDEPFAAAFVTRIVMEGRELAQGYSYWTFSDIFSENYFPSIPFHSGFGLLNLHGIAKPSYRAFQLLHNLGTEFLEIHGAHETVDAWAVRKGKALAIILTNLAMPRHAIQMEQVSLRLAGGPAPLSAYIERIDEDHANPRKLWTTMGEPEQLSHLQLSQLEIASLLTREALPLVSGSGTIDFKVDLPPQSVAGITIEFA
jgi:xylan 1,4-beta-xylosidase